MQWARVLPYEFHSAQAIADKKLYIGAEDGANGTVLCLDADTGDTMWEYHTNGKVKSSPAIAA